MSTSAPVTEQVKALPKGWWQELAACHTFARLFSKHLLALQMVFRHEGQTYQDLYTGFPMWHRDRLMWATAGHVIDEIRERADSPAYEVGGACWLDGCEIAG